MSIMFNASIALSLMKSTNKRGGRAMMLEQHTPTMVTSI
jgi:hypothetical protein